MGAWKIAFFLQEKTSTPIKFLVLGGGGEYFVLFGGGGREGKGSADFTFMGARTFLKNGNGNTSLVFQGV